MTRSSLPIFQRILHWRYLYVINLLLILLIAISFGREMMHRRDIDSQILSLQKQAQNMQTQNTVLSELHDAVQTESYIEREARLKLGLKKPGESVVVLKGGDSDRNEKKTDSGKVGDMSDPLGLVSDGSGIKKPLANSTKWWYYFFNKQAYHDSMPL